MNSEDIMNSVIPAGAIGTISGLYYKIGQLGRVYYWNNGGWVLSNREAVDVREYIGGMRHPFSIIDDSLKPESDETNNKN